MFYKYEYGQEVRVLRNVRNDGTYPGKETGEMLVRRGSVGFVRDVGTFLQDQIIYTVDFLDEKLMVGCREEELIGAEEHWVPSRFEFRDKVITLIPIRAGEEVVAEAGTHGEVEKVLRDHPSGVMYFARFNGRVFQVPEKALDVMPRPKSNPRAYSASMEE